MRSDKIRRLVPAAVLLLLAASFSSAAEEYRIRFVLDHSPSAASAEAARDFKARVEKETGGRVLVELLTPAEYKVKYNGGRGVGRAAVLARVAAGRLEMCETFAGTAGSYHHSLWVLGMPYQFHGDAHAEAVLDGPVGRDLLDGLLTASRKRGALRGLAFTRAGFAVLASADPGVRAVKDLRGLRLQVPSDPMSQAVARKLDAEAVAAPSEAFVPLAQNDLADAAETTFADFDEGGLSRAAVAILNTGHSLVTTLLVINDAFFQTLPEKDRAVVERAAADAARAQRRASVRANADARKRLEAAGVKIVDLTAEDKERLKESLLAILGDVGAMLGIRGQDAIEAIEAAAPKDAP